MDNQALQKIRDTISRAQNVAISVSANPSVDQMAAALGLYLTLESQGKKVTVVSPSEPIVELSSLVGIDKVKTSNEGTGGDLVVSFPYREGEIEKVSYTIEDGFLNIVVKAGETGLTFSEQDVIFKRGSGKAEMLITVGVQSMNDIANLFPEDSVKDATVINIDNNSANDGFGAMVLVSPKFSSLSEQVADLMLNLGYEIDIDVAQNLLSGISTATNNFQNPNTSYLAFEIAAILLKRGAVRARAGAGGQAMPSMQMQPQMRQSQPQQQNRQAAQPQQQSQRQQQLPQQQQPRRDDRQDRRDAIRNALRMQAQNRNDQQPRQDQPQQTEEQPRQEKQAQSQPQEQQQNRQSDQQQPPSDWLTPKVYKGSTSV